MARYRPDIITPEAIATPQRVWLIMGALDSLAGVMQSLALAKITSGGLVVLLLQVRADRAHRFTNRRIAL